MTAKRELRNQLLLARQHLHHKRWGKALETLKRAAELDPPNLEIRLQVARLCQDQNQCEEALKYLDSILAQEQEYHPALVLRGNILLSQGKPRQALESYLRAAERQEDPEIYYNMGICYRSLQETLKAENAFLRTWKISPREALGLLAGAQTALGRGRIEEAHQILEQAVRLFPHYAPAKEELAQIYILIKRLDEAEKLLRDLLAEGHDAVTVQHRLGSIAAERGKWREAIDLWQEVIRRSPAADETLREIGWAHHILREPSEAENFLKRALQINPDNARALIDLGTVYFRNGWLQGAMDAWNHALAKEPGNAVLKHHLEQAQDLMRRHGPMIFPDPEASTENGPTQQPESGSPLSPSPKILPIESYRSPRSPE